MAGDRRAAQAFEEAELDFVRAQGVQAVETFSEAGQRFTGQAEDQISVQVGVAVIDQPGQVFASFGVVLPARDGLLNLRIEGLDADFKLQHASGKRGD